MTPTPEKSVLPFSALLQVEPLGKRSDAKFVNDVVAAKTIWDDTFAGDPNLPG